MEGVKNHQAELVQGSLGFSREKKHRTPYLPRVVVSYYKLLSPRVLSTLIHWYEFR